MKKVYICSPYASQGIKEQNVKNAVKYCRMAMEKGVLANSAARILYADA